LDCEKQAAIPRRIGCRKPAVDYKPSERTPDNVAGSGAGDAHIVRGVLRARIARRSTRRPIRRKKT
jgi:hypothetical protein